MLQKQRLNLVSRGWPRGVRLCGKFAKNALNVVRSSRPSFEGETGAEDKISKGRVREETRDASAAGGMSNWTIYKASLTTPKEALKSGMW